MVISAIVMAVTDIVTAAAVMAFVVLIIARVGVAVHLATTVMGSTTLRYKRLATRDNTVVVIIKGLDYFVTAISATR